MKLSGDFEFKLIAAGVVLVVVGVLVYRAKEAVEDMADAINPLSNDNVINQAAMSLYQGVTGSTGSMGSDFYDFTHPDAAEGTNIINGMATSVYQRVSGRHDSIGAGIYDWWNN